MDTRGKIVLWVGLMCIMGLIGWGVYVYESRHVSPLGVSPVQSKQEMDAVVAKFETPRAAKLYKIKKTMNVMGMSVIRIESRQYPQEFVVVNDLSHDFVSDVFDEKMDPGLVESMINEALKLKSGKNVSMDIQKLDMKEKGSLKVNNKTLPYRKMRIVFRLSSETGPRAYAGELVREPGENNLDTLVVSFTRAPLEKDDLQTSDDPQTGKTAKPGTTKASGAGMKITLSRPPRPVKTYAFKPALLEAFMRTLASA